MSNLEAIQALIERTDKALLEQAAFDPVPLCEKTATLAMLYQAAALERIANTLYQIYASLSENS